MNPWKLLNEPLPVALVSTVLVGLVAFGYGAFTDSLRRREAARQRTEALRIELDERLAAICQFTTGGGTDDDMRTIARAFDPATQAHSRAEFAGSSTLAIYAEWCALDPICAVSAPDLRLAVGNVKAHLWRVEKNTHSRQPNFDVDASLAATRPYFLLAKKASCVVVVTQLLPSGSERPDAIPGGLQ